jgi:serine/threonine-protein kinase
MVGQTLGHYRILEKVGAGGMGVIYRARDEQLERDVAVKVLPPGTLSDETARRHFRKEAMALAKLSHPNIETIYEFGTQNGTDFLVMEYLPGKTLADRLAGGPWAEKEILALGMQIAAALQEAHERGIVHRDLKPANIAITARGEAKVLDFGLAKLIRRESQLTTDNLTDTGMAAGTLPYMPPEQLRGELVDARADVYTIGAVLYEMATNCRAFAEAVPSRLIDAILHQLPVSPRALNHRVSPELERVILKCLEKEPDRRYQSAKELGVDLRRLAMPSVVTSASKAGASKAWPRVVQRVTYGATALLVLALVLLGLNVGGWRGRVFRSSAPSAPPSIRSLAVLPLVNLSGDPGQEYFTDGMTEELISRLAKIGALRVISRTSVMHYKGTRKTLPEIARELNVDAVMEGSVLSSGNRVRISAQLIHANSDQHLWTESYERDLRDVIALQSEVARSVANAIRVQLTPVEAGRLDSTRPVDRDAYQLYLKGRYYWNKRNSDALKKSLQYFQQAVSKDPQYAPAYAGLADTYRLLGEFAVLPFKASIVKAKEAAQIALKLDDNLAEAHASLGMANLMDHFDWREADRQLLAAIELNPGYAMAYQWYAMSLASTGRAEEGVRMARRAQELDPLSLIINAYLGFAYYQVRNYDSAIDQCRRTLELDPNFAVGHSFLALVYAQKGTHGLALEEARKGVELSGGAANLKAIQAAVYAAAGKRREAQQMAAQLAKSAHDGYLNPGEIALVYAQLQEKDYAFQWLRTAYEEGSIWTVFLKSEPVLDGLRSDPRFTRLLHQVELPD